MIRALRRKGLAYRAIAELCGCSHGSVHAEILAMKKEDAAKKLLEEQEKLKEIEEEMQTNSLGVEPVVVDNNLDMLPADANQTKS